MVLETCMKLCVTEPDFLDNFFLFPKLGKWTKNGPKQGFLNLLNNLVISFYWICSIMKIYIICCVPTQILYLGKFFLFLRYGPKFSKRIRLHDFLINHISRTNQYNSLIFCMLIGVVSNGCGQSGHVTLKLNVPQE